MTWRTKMVTNKTQNLTALRVQFCLLAGHQVQHKSTSGTWQSHFRNREMWLHMYSVPRSSAPRVRLRILAVSLISLHTITKSSHQF
jgi:hypothetical protein